MLLSPDFKYEESGVMDKNDLQGKYLTTYANNFLAIEGDSGKLALSQALNGVVLPEYAEMMTNTGLLDYKGNPVQSYIINDDDRTDLPSASILFE